MLPCGAPASPQPPLLHCSRGDRRAVLLFTVVSLTAGGLLAASARLPGRSTTSSVIRRVSRRRAHRGARARDPAGHRRRRAVEYRRAVADRHRARSRAGRDGPVAREVPVAAADGQADHPRPRGAGGPQDAARRGRRPLRRAAGDHRRHLGHRVELRELQRRAADGRRARDAGVGFRGGRRSSAGSCSPRSRSSIAATSTRRGCGGPGPARWARCSSCHRAT